MKRSPMCLFAFALGLSLALLLAWLLSGSLPAAHAAPPARPLAATIIVTTTIQAAVDAAATDDTIVIPAGTYTENVNISGKVLTFVGAGAANTIVDGGGAGRVFSSTSGITLADLTIRNGNIAGAGGGLYTSGALTLTNVAVLSNTASSWGGGAYAVGAVTLAGGLFQNNRNTSNQGGGLYAGSTLALTGTQFISNYASSLGGGAYAAGAATLAGGLFQNNRTGSQGGGLYAGSTLALTGTQFISNTASGSGGGVYAFGGVTLSGDLFQNNQSTASLGGGLYARNTLKLTGAQFVSNTASSSGGGAYANLAATLDGGLFQNNRSTSSVGGGLFAGNTLALTGTQFISNAASGDGGGAYFNGNARVTGSTFMSNTTGAKGAGAMFNATANLVGGAFTSNRATFNGGGAVWVGISGVNTISGTTFLNNRAGSNGGGGDMAGPMAVTSTTFISNTASGSGGGVWFDWAYPKQMVNVLFASNSAGVDGAALHVQNATPAQLIHVTIVSATLPANATQAIYVGGGTVYITNTIITSHTIGISQTAGTVMAWNTLFFGNTSNTAGTVTNNSPVSGDPAFADPNADDYHLTLASAAINTGVNAGVYTDFEGDPRPAGGGYDIGYDEGLFTTLTLVKYSSPEPAIAGLPLTYTIVITNNSSTAANGVTLSDTLPPSTTLLLLDQTDDHAAEFQAGAFVNTAWHEPKPYSRWLAITNTSLLAGTFTSRVMDGVGPVAWDTLEWEPLAPYWKELPGSRQVENDYARGRADMTDNRILLHLNESAGALLLSDSSGLGNHATCSNCPTAGAAGRFNTALSFNGAGNSIVVTDTFDPTEYTIEAWVNLTSTADANIIYRTDVTGTLASHRLGVSGGRFVHTLYDGVTRTITGTTVAATGVWYHVAGVATHNGDMRLYVNGAQEAGASGVGSPWVGGDRYLLGVGLSGSLDEVAVFSRALSFAEIADHYKRGALRIAFQVRSCDDALCSGESWLGPDGTSATYYSELLNTTLGLPSSSITVADQRYFQYKAFLYTDDTALSPELRWVRVLPDHRRIVPSQGSCVAPGAQSFTCDVGAIAGSGVVSITAYVDVNPWALGLITNTVWVSATNAPSVTVETVSTVVEQADLHVHKDDYYDPVNPGSPLTYTISVHNDGPSAARSLTLTDTLPISVVNVTPNHGWSCDRMTNTITCTLASIGPGYQWDSVVVSGLAPMISGTITNTVWLTATTPETDPSDNTHDETTLIVPLSDLVIVKSANPDPVDPGSTLTYVLTVTNNGPYTATSVVVNDWLPSSVTWGGGAGCTHTSGVVTCTVASLDPLASTTLNLTVTTPLTGFLVNVAQVTSAVRDPDTSNNTTYAYAAVRPVADLSIVKSDDPDPVFVGLPLTYTLTFSNTGPTAAGTLTTTLAFSNEFGIGIPGSGHAYPYPSVIPVSSLAGDVQNVLVTLADLDHSFPNDLSVLLVGPGGQSIVLMSGVSSQSRLTDSVTLAFDDAAASVLPPTDVITSGVYRPTNYGVPGSLPSPAPSGPYGGSLSTFRGATPNGDWRLYVMDWVEEDAGSIGHWSLQLTVVADGVVTVTDNLPTGMTSGNIAAPAGWACQPGSTVTCVAPRLEMNAPASIVVTATAPVVGGLITNTAAITSTMADSNVALNTAQITTTVIAQVDLQISKSVSPDPVLAGQLLTYTLTFTNAGPGQITSAIITDTLPAGATVVSAPGCTPAGSQLTCAVAVPAVNTPASLVIVVNAPPDAGVITNTAEITAAAAIELAPLDNTAWVTSTVTPSADLVIVKSDSPDPVAQGGSIAYTVVVSNNGPSVATNVVLTDSVPTSATFQSLASPAGWNCAMPPVGGTGNVVCTNPSLAAGTSATFTFVVRLVAGAPNGAVIYNTATVSSDTPDPAMPNAATASTTVGLYKIYLPLVFRNHAFAPDLVVTSISVLSGDVRIIVENQGDVAVPVDVSNEFWVDLYINPTTPPTAVNQTRETLGCQGGVWGVTVAALPQLVPGGVLTLTLNDAYYWPSKSDMPATLPAGTPIYAQVDSANTDTNYGAVLENHEIMGLPYNNIWGPVYPTFVTSEAFATPLPLTGYRPPESLGNLPPRP